MGAVPDDAPDGPHGRISRAKEGARRLRDTGEAMWDRVVELRPDTPLLDAGWETVERDSATGGGLLAGAIAFRLFLLVVPLVLLLFSWLGFLSAGTEKGAEGAGQSLQFSRAVAASMERVGTTAQNGRWVTLAVGLFALVLATRTLIKSMRIVHLLAWRLPRRKAPNTVLSTLVGIGVIAGVVAYGALSQWLRQFELIGGVGMSILLGTGLGFAWFWVQQLLPRADDVPWTALVPGAVLIGVASQGLHAFTVFYLADHMSRMSEYYGSLGVAMVMLLWLFILGRSVVAAAMLNATLWDRRVRGARNYAPIDPRVFRLAPPARVDDTRPDDTRPDDTRADGPRSDDGAGAGR
ncbi:MAG: YhjD/YihY/BrkB family envelope integrity protein [Microthrixaceae bacterium]